MQEGPCASPISSPELALAAPGGQFPPGVKPVDFLDGDYALEFKRIEQEPLTADGRVEKIAEFAAEQVAKGEASAKNDVVRFSRHASQDYWGKFLGVSARCQLEKRVETRRSSNANANS